ncbi:MAG TPA: OmpA family protein [Alphaproteobacteria bacterium]|nr:OmpA family protein [Alphaproteobacteria bacterium]
MKLGKALGALVGLLLLGACYPDYINANLGPVEQTPGQGSAFAQALHKEYSALARKLQAGRHLSDALYWNAKSSRAAAGEEVAPESPNLQGMPPQAGNDPAIALNRVLKSDARTRDPADLAIAQVSYDCMMRHWERDVYNGILDECQKNFYDAIMRLEGAPPPPPPPPIATDFWLYFDFNSAALRADAMAVLEGVLDSIRRLGGAGVMITGHTDTVGSVAYNQALSVHRAQAAARFLEQHGVARNSVHTIGKGKTDLRVPTPDQVREQENRNVHIELRK